MVKKNTGEGLKANVAAAAATGVDDVLVAIGATAGGIAAAVASVVVVVTF